MIHGDGLADSHRQNKKIFLLFGRNEYVGKQGMADRAARGDPRRPLPSSAYMMSGDNLYAQSPNQWVRQPSASITYTAGDPSGPKTIQTSAFVKGGPPLPRGHIAESKKLFLVARAFSSGPIAHVYRWDAPMAGQGRT